MLLLLWAVRLGVSWVRGATWREKRTVLCGKLLALLPQSHTWLGHGCVSMSRSRVSHRGVLVLLVLVLPSRCDNNRRVLF
jgi:hypothetical protein